jgi:hypothetical protein
VVPVVTVSDPASVVSIVSNPIIAPVVLVSILHDVSLSPPSPLGPLPPPLPIAAATLMGV